MESIFSRRGLAFIAIFGALAFVALQVNIFALQGVTGQSFTLFEFFGPIAGAFIGIVGVVAIGIAKLAEAIFTGTPLTLIDLAKLTPMLFAAWYFWKNGARGAQDKLGIIVPVIAIAAFWLNPVGQQVWFFALYWTIPIIAKFLPDRLFLRSLGSTFTAHAVGSVLFLYTIPSAPALWIALIPMVVVERLSFTVGISAAYVFFTNVLNAVDRVWNITKYVNVEKRYVLSLSAPRQ
jgi:hypothetical protein